MGSIQPIVATVPQDSRLIGWVSIKTMAELLEISEETVREWVRHGFLPQPTRLRGLVRWRWADVEIHLANLTQSAQAAQEEADPILKASRGK